MVYLVSSSKRGKKSSIGSKNGACFGVISYQLIDYSLLFNISLTNG